MYSKTIMHTQAKAPDRYINTGNPENFSKLRHRFK